jgi:hypothetical protein
MFSKTLFMVYFERVLKLKVTYGFQVDHFLSLFNNRALSFNKKENTD